MSDAIGELGTTVLTDLVALQKILDASEAAGHGFLDPDEIEVWINSLTRKITRFNKSDSALQHGEEGTKTKDDLVKSLRELGYGVLLYSATSSMSKLHLDMVNMMLDQIFIAGMERHYHPVCDVFGNDRREELVNALMNHLTAIREGASDASRVQRPQGLPW